MGKLFTVLSLLCVAAFVAVGGCTPEANKTWSENVDLNNLDPSLRDMTASYEVYTDVDGRFGWLTLVQTGSSIQGYDNLGRHWNGSISGFVGPYETEVVNNVPVVTGTTGGGVVNIETGDDPAGQTVIVGDVVFLFLDDVSYMGIEGQIRMGDRTGGIMLVGPMASATTTTTTN